MIVTRIFKKQFLSSISLVKVFSLFKFANRISTMRPEGIVEDWSCKITPEEVAIRTDNIIKSIKNIYHTVSAVPDDEVSAKNILKELDKAEWQLRNSSYFLMQMQHFLDEEKSRNASRDAENKLQALNVELSMNHEVFCKLNVLKKKNEDLQADLQRYLDKMILDGKRNGLHLDAPKREEIKDLKNKINELSVQFSTNVAEDTTTLEFSEAELIGMPKDFIDNLDKSDSGKLKVTMKYPDYFPIMKNCRNPETRRAMYLAYNTRCKQNKTILLEVLQLRQKVAGILGYPNHVSYITEVLMSKSQEAVSKFLAEIGTKLKPLWKEEKQYLLELKEKECQDLGIPFDGELHMYDCTFYTTRVEEIKYAVDQNKLKLYFPLTTVTKGLCEIYQTLLGVTFTEIQNEEIWHEDVKCFQVRDTSSGTLLGYFFLDLHPRTGKYGHAAVFEFQPGCRKPDGTRQVAVAAMLTNFSKPQKDRPSLLDSNEVQTFFHEFGHLMHYICAQADLVFFEPFAVERDFIEAPSQMLENWCYEREPLRMMSGHYSDQSPIPDDLMSALTKSRLANAGYTNLRQIALSTFDFKIHSSPILESVEKVYDDTILELLGLDPMEGTSMPCTFNHMVNGYDAQYYGYMWSEVFSDDMFDTCFRGGKILDPAAGKRYREKILQPGSSKDAMDMLIDFLGREPTEKAFLRNKGVLVE